MQRTIMGLWLVLAVVLVPALVKAQPAQRAQPEQPLGEPPREAPLALPEWGSDRNVVLGNALRRTVRVNWDAGISAPDLRDLLKVMNGSKFIMPIAKQALAKEPQEEDVMRLTFVGGDRQGGGGSEVLVFTVLVHGAELGEGTARYVDLLARAVGDMARNQWREVLERAYARRLQSAEHAEHELRAVANNHAELRERLRDALDRTDVSPEGLQRAIASLEEERQKASLQLLGQEVRRRAIEEAIRRMGDKARAQIEEDAVAKELKVMVQHATGTEERMQALLKDKNIPESEVMRARAEAAQARARLLERQELVAARSGGELMAELTKELTILSINSAEVQGRSDAVGKTLVRFRKAAREIDGLEAAMATRARAERALNAAVEERDAFRRKIELLGWPQVVIQG